MIHYGADRVITVTHENLEHYTSEAYSQAILPIIEDEDLSGFVMGHTALGKDLTPKIAARFKLGLVSVEVDIEMDGDTPVDPRPIYTGKAFEHKKIVDDIA